MGKWRQRFVEHRLAGLYDELRPGRPRSIEDEQIAALLKRTLSRKPATGTHWSIRQAAQASGISRSTPSPPPRVHLLLTPSGRVGAAGGTRPSPDR